MRPIYSALQQKPVRLGVDQPVQAVGGGLGEAEQHRLSGGAGELVLGGLANQLGAIGVGEDQAGVGSGKMSAGTAAWVAKNSRSQERRYPAISGRRGNPRPTT